MRKNLICLLFLSLLFSCNEDDSIVGTYKLAFLSQSNCPDSSENFALNFGDSNCATTGGIEFCESGVFNFSESGNFTSTIRLTSLAVGEIFNLNGAGTYVENGNIVTICSPDCEDFEFEDNTLILRQTFDGCDQVSSFSEI